MNKPMKKKRRRKGWRVLTEAVCLWRNRRRNYWLIWGNDKRGDKDPWGGGALVDLDGFDVQAGKG